MGSRPRLHSRLCAGITEGAVRIEGQRSVDDGGQVSNLPLRGEEVEAVRGIGVVGGGR